MLGIRETFEEIMSYPIKTRQMMYNIYDDILEYHRKLFENRGGSTPDII